MLQVSTQLYNVPQTLGSTYSWIVDGGTITSGQGTNFISVLWGGGVAGQVAVVETTSGGCPGDTVFLNTNINPSGVEEVLEVVGFRTWPNPASNSVTVQVIDPAMTRYNLSITDLTGRIVHTQNGLSATQLTLDIANLPSGAYVITLSGSTVHQERLLIQR